MISFAWVEKIVVLYNLTKLKLLDKDLKNKKTIYE